MVSNFRDHKIVSVMDTRGKYRASEVTRVVIMLQLRAQDKRCFSYSVNEYGEDLFVRQWVKGRDYTFIFSGPDVQTVLLSVGLVHATGTCDEVQQLTFSTRGAHAVIVRADGPEGYGRYFVEFRYTKGYQVHSVLSSHVEFVTV